jgi:AcrR family transcriptional regulator
VASRNARQALLEKIVDYFIANGVGDISLRALAAEVDSSHRMLIYHFGSREGLLTAVADQVWQSQREVLEELADRNRENPT